MSKYSRNKSINILLVNPWIYDFTAYDFWSKPLGLLYLASILRDQGHHINYIDCMDRYNPGLLRLQNKISPKKDEFGRGPFYKEEITKPEILKNIPRRYSRYGITEDIFINELKKIKYPQIVLVTSLMTYWYPGVFRAIALIKEYFPSVPIILGGIYSTLCFEHALQFSQADYIIKGNDWKEIFSHLKNITEHKIQDIKQKHDLDFLPYPDWNLYSCLDYICVLTSRGCPFRCTYCASSILNPKLEFRNALQVAREIEYWYQKKRIRDFVFYDDALLINSGRNFLALLEELINRRLNIRLHTPNGIHARMINEEIAIKMFQAGVETVRLGFETVNPEAQFQTGGKVTNIQFKRAVELLLKAGFKRDQIGAYLLIGLPGQKEQEIIDSINFVIDCGAHPRLAKFSLIPGTKIWGKSKDYFNLSTELDPLWHNDALLPYLSPDINSEILEKIKELIKRKVG
ncbi:MAG: B12-binding domain-containing radical SAM protein [Candidatus Caldatribacteriota bacterium]